MELSFETYLDSCDLTPSEYLSQCARACHVDERYKQRREKIHELFRKYPKLKEVVDLNEPSALSKEECAALIEYICCLNVIHELEAEQVYFKGCADCVGFLKKMKLL